MIQEPLFEMSEAQLACVLAPVKLGQPSSPPRAILAIPKLSADQKIQRFASKNQNCQLYNKWANPSRQLLSPFVFNTINPC